MLKNLVHTSEGVLPSGVPIVLSFWRVCHAKDVRNTNTMLFKLRSIFRIKVQFWQAWQCGESTGEKGERMAVWCAHCVGKWCQHAVTTWKEGFNAISPFTLVHPGSTLFIP